MMKSTEKDVQKKKKIFPNVFVENPIQFFPFSSLNSSEYFIAFLSILFLILL